MLYRRMRAGLAWMVVLAGCRLGFDQVAPGDGAAGDDAGTTVELHVVTDEYGNDARGAPIAGATVLIDRGQGLERRTTDATGSELISTAGLAAIHVVVHGDLGWRVYTVVAPPPGVLELGGRPGAQGARSMTFTLPDSGALGYTVRVAEHCGIPPNNGGRVVGLDLAPACEGQGRRVVGFVDQIDGSATYLEGGVVTLAAGTNRTLAGAYRPLQRYVAAIDHLTGAASSVGVRIVERTDLDLLPLTSAFEFTPTPISPAQITTFAAPGGNAIEVDMLNGNAPVQYLVSSDSFLPATVKLGTAVAIDAAGLVPPFDALILTKPPSVAWTGAPGGTLAIVETITGDVQWDAYLPASATSVDFPAVPADLGLKIPTSFDFASAMKLDVPGATRASLQPTIDRRWSLWPHDELLLPAAGSTLSRILYSVGLGPP